MKELCIVLQFHTYVNTPIKIFFTNMNLVMNAMIICLNVFLFFDIVRFLPSLFPFLHLSFIRVNDYISLIPRF